MSVESHRETAAVCRRTRVVVSEVVEDGDRELPESIPPFGICLWNRVEDQLEGALEIVRLERCEHVGEVATGPQLLELAVDSRGSEELVQERRDARRGLRADELGDHATGAEPLDGR